MKFVFDLDGTICFGGKPVSNRVLHALEKLRDMGHEVIFASARPIRDLLPVLHERFHQYPMIGGNGAIVANAGKVLSTICFDPTIFTSITQLLDRYEVSYLIDSDWDYAYTGPADHPILNNLDPQKRAAKVTLEELQTIVKILILTASDMEKVEKELQQINVIVHSYGNEGILDISPTGIDKWSGLRQLGVIEEEYIAFGNDANDIAIFQHALYSIMIGDNIQLAPYSCEQLRLDKNIEDNLVSRLRELSGMEAPK